MSKVQRTESVAILSDPLEVNAPLLPHPRKVPSKVQAAAMEGQGSDHPTSGSPQTLTGDSAVTKRSLSEIDIAKDVILRLKKEGGSFNYVPLSIGRLNDLWWRPVSARVYERVRGATLPVVVLEVQFFIDAPGDVISHQDREMTISFKSSAIETMKIAYLYHFIKRELHSERRMSYDEWYRFFAAKFRIEDSTSEAAFAVNVMNYVLDEAITRVPGSFGVFLQKKASAKVTYPPDCIREHNYNSLPCEAASGFKFEIRARLFVCSPVEAKQQDLQEILSQTLGN